VEQAATSLGAQQDDLNGIFSKSLLNPRAFVE